MITGELKSKIDRVWDSSAMSATTTESTAETTVENAETVIGNAAGVTTSLGGTFSGGQPTPGRSSSARVTGQDAAPATAGAR